MVAAGNTCVLRCLTSCRAPGMQLNRPTMNPQGPCGACQVIIWVELTTEQRAYYKAIYEKQIGTVGG